jgi:phosphoglycerate dehydrogenase-like enzyme
MSVDTRVLVYEKMRPGTAIVDQLKAAGLEGDLPFGPTSNMRRGAPLSASEFIELAYDYPVVIGASCAKLDRTVLSSLPNLRMISKLGIGYDVIDLDAATDLGIAVTNTPSPVEIKSVAEHAVALMLACAKRLDFYSAERMRSGKWQDYGVSAISMLGRTVGIIGFGRIGRETANLLKTWGMRVLIYDLRPTNLPDFVESVDLDTLLAESDFVSLHLAKEIGMGPVLGADEIAKLKDGAIVVNTSRGGNIDQEALVEAMRAGKITAAGLDVFAVEPPPVGSGILEVPNTILTPHLGAVTPESETDMDRMAAENVIRFLNGDLPESLLNPDFVKNRRG